MAEYRRFISYMYLYENGRKTINSGFVRVESRNGQCRLSIHMSGIYHSVANCPHASADFDSVSVLRKKRTDIHLDFGSEKIRYLISR